MMTTPPQTDSTQNLSSPSTPKSVRRHDLDAVRSFAMLLGIFLHAALAYIGGWWVVTDSPSSRLLGTVVSGIHGFRMPLFFLLSGFFTAMLWQKRGLGGLLSNRSKRIAIPLLIGCFTVIPAMTHVSGWATTLQSTAIDEPKEVDTASVQAPSDDIWTVSAWGEMDGLRKFGPDSAELDMPDPSFGVTPLGWAALRDQPEAAAYLLEIGADPSARYRDTNTPMHTACFFGRAEIAGMLFDAGADLSARNATGELPLDGLNHTKQTTEFIANMVQVPIDFDQVSAAREQIRERTQHDAPLSKHKEVRSNRLAIILHVNFFHHLWFLWFLCLMVAGFAVVVSVAQLLPAIVIPRWLVSLPLSLIWVVPLSMTTQWFMQSQGPGFGPDTSTGIIPSPHVLLHYTIFFGFGSLVYLVRGAAERFGPRRSWAVIIPIAVPLLFLGLTLEFSQDAAAFIGNELTHRLLSDFVQVLYAWLMTLGVISLFESLLHRERVWVRYLSDSSYWLYLMHLPLVIAGQAILLQSDYGPIVKSSLLTALVTIGLLVIYHFGVRYTPIGTMLNGKRVRPRKILELKDPISA